MGSISRQRSERPDPTGNALALECGFVDKVAGLWYSRSFGRRREDRGQMSVERIARAWELLQEAYKYQMEGELELAVDLYQRSIDTHPTAEAYTFLGWTYHHQGKTEKAIAECKKAIALDPDFGNPYNDIGAYLIEQGRHGEAVEWLDKAIRSKRYASYHYPHYNLGRVYMAQDQLNDARRCFQRALELAPDYALAREALEQLRRKVM